MDYFYDATYNLCWKFNEPTYAGGPMTAPMWSIIEAYHCQPNLSGWRSMSSAYKYSLQEAINYFNETMANAKRSTLPL